MVKTKNNKNLILIIIILLALFTILMINNKIDREKVLTDLTSENIKAELEKLEKINVYPLKINEEDYPKIVGEYKGLKLVEIYYCSDICPDYARVVLIYENISKEECSKIGEEVNAVFPPEYLGCRPRIELAEEKPEENQTEQIKECITDNDCVPATCCHPSSCVSKENAPVCEGIFCTQECAPGTLDCGQGYCGCVNGKCEAVFNR